MNEPIKLDPREGVQEPVDPETLAECGIQAPAGAHEVPQTTPF